MPTLNWVGRDKVVNHHHDVPFKLLDKKYSFNGADSAAADGLVHRIIHGDNLEALKSLLPEFEGKINCIYIDPPYNTGNEEWVYNDNSTDPKLQAWLGKVVGKEGEDLSRHDKWLCMMFPRLKLLQKLLASEGAIFISIDRVESAFLRLICNEVFGVNNFVTEIACVNNPKGRSDDKYIATAHESILVYKSKTLDLGGFEPGEHITKRFTKKEGDGAVYREIDLRKTGSNDLREDRPNMFYPFFYKEDTGELIVGSQDENTPQGYLRIEPMKAEDVEGCWRWGRDTAVKQIDLLMARYMPAKKQWGVFEKDYLENKTSVRPTSVWDMKDVNSERGTEMFIKMLGFDKKDFPNPKPVGTIERIIQIATKPDAIILDSFAGSGTTGHAVLNMNKKDGGNRRFILVEQEDYAEKITAERVRRVINGFAEFEGTGGAFEFYSIGKNLFKDDETLNEEIPEALIRHYVAYTEGIPDAAKCVNRVGPITNHAALTVSPHSLGLSSTTSWVFYYEPHQVTTLNMEFLTSLNVAALKNAGLPRPSHFVIYADKCALDKELMAKFGITFKRIPRDITRL